MKDSRKELFVVDGVVYEVYDIHQMDKADKISRRPGILVLINDADWELEEEEKYELANGDNVLFVSTLHGG